MPKDRSTKATLIPQKPGHITLSQKRQCLALALALFTFNITFYIATKSLIAVYHNWFFLVHELSKLTFWTPFKTYFPQKRYYGDLNCPSPSLDILLHFSWILFEYHTDPQEIIWTCILWIRTILGLVETQEKKNISAHFDEICICIVQCTMQNTDSDLPAIID